MWVPISLSSELQVIWLFLWVIFKQLVWLRLIDLSATIYFKTFLLSSHILIISISRNWDLIVNQKDLWRLWLWQTQFMKATTLLVFLTVKAAGIQTWKNWTRKAVNSSTLFCDVWPLLLPSCLLIIICWQSLCSVPSIIWKLINKQQNQ